MQSHNAKLKTAFIFVLGALFLSGCVRNVDLRREAQENKAQEKKSITSMQGAVDLPIETVEAKNIEPSGPVKILFVGDAMFDRHIREAVGKYGGGDYNYVLQSLKEKLSEYDLVVGNLEGPITNKESISVNTEMGESKNFVFTFDPAVAGVLEENNIKLVNLGNNHILNQGAKGIDETKEYLDKAGVGYFGDTGMAENKFITKEINGKKIGFVGYNYSVPNSIEAAIGEIKSAKEQSNIVVVCPHWGTEYKTGDPGESVRALAHRFIDAGADAIVGTHPHVVENSEEYNEKKIYYSLGNFVFDQYFQPETMEGLGVEIEVSPDGGAEYSELVFEMTKRGQTVLKTGN